MPVVICEFCGKEFNRFLSNIKRSKRHFCSKECWNKVNSIPIEERFFKRIEKQENGCWLWTGYLNKNGYGMIGYKGETIKAHRISWIIHHGDISEGMRICHTCDNPSCVNPEHLFGILRVKLTKDKVLEIRELYKDGEYTVRGLARKYSVPRSTIGDVLTKRTWKK